ncbi:MAG TPA: hypothetical protein VNX18_13450 [Bryobacteraceae bacterium]|jgi:hypothetical protein|nr:hypothetical protein [Bryobacteraceae bacterium]
MTNFRRRILKLEAQMTDTSGLVPHTQKWLEHWDRQWYLYMTDQIPREALQNSPWQALAAVMQYSHDPRSLVGSIPPFVEDGPL